MLTEIALTFKGYILLRFMLIHSIILGGFWYCILNNSEEKMKKKNIVILCLMCLAILFLIGVIANELSPVQTDNNKIADNSTDAPTTKPDQQEPVKQIEWGTRKNPAKVGQTISATIDNFMYGECELEIELTEVIKGEKAWDVISEASPINSEPDEGKEYIMAKFLVKNVKDLSGEDESISINSFQFNYANSQDTVDEDLKIIVGVEPDLDCELYEGAENEGWVILVSDVGEESPKAVFIGEFWFDLSGE